MSKAIDGPNGSHLSRGRAKGHGRVLSTAVQGAAVGQSSGGAHESTIAAIGFPFELDLDFD